MPLITSIGEILFDVYDTYKTAGGAPFNFIYHIIKITGTGNFISRIGKDEYGKEILDILNDKNIDAGNIQTDALHPTGRAVANLDENKIPSWVIEENTAYDFIEIQSNIENIIRKTDCLYFGTLAQRNSVSRETIHYLFGRNIKYFCDLNIRQNFFTKEIISRSLKTSDVLKLNEDELILLNNLFLTIKYELISSAIQLKNLFNIDLLCVTCGENGSYLFWKEKIDFYKPEPVNPVDTVGAGDAFASILCLGYMNDWDIEKLNRTAGNFAAQVIMIKGALPENDDFYSEVKNIYDKK